MPTYSPSKNLPVLALILTAACGSDSGGRSNTTVGDVANQFASLGNELAGSNYVETSDIPTTGAANYQGAALFTNSDGDDGLVGQVDMTVGFLGGGRVDGSIDDFVYINDIVDAANNNPDSLGHNVNGVLTFTNGEIDRTAATGDVQLWADLSGDLNASVDMFGAGTHVAVDAVFGATFLEGGLEGEVFGTITPSGGTPEVIGGVVLATEQ
ncbi:hypothetical protein [Yoonia maritima]|uniref:hypothetical protein n=1 Tax=Yoonia maritima TaxID=1435347 RepID=UPI003736AAE2